ncbi:hypothetical protein [Salicibibacter halophilus]|uniref:hypothetical protein n=1 Tax=Salicibibacter halophilus TaxID=2502791 RepID=UPI00135ABE8B|nr:hypothetical protein [Salicibibacter halophilus]
MTTRWADQSGEKLPLSFAFPDAYTDEQKQQMTTSINDKTGWETVPESFSIHFPEKTFEQPSLKITMSKRSQFNYSQSLSTKKTL